MASTLIEVCVDSPESAIAAEHGGAQRVELCADLLEGGTTPSAGAIAVARKSLGIALQVIIRPRGADFCYSDLELEAMKHDIGVAKQHGADGVVLGVLTPDADVDTERTRALVELARPMSVTFHRAFDMVRDPRAALEQLVSLGVDRILTEGQAESIWEGLPLVTELIERAGDRIIVMPGGGRESNVRTIVSRTGAHEIHVVGTRTVESRMQYRNTRAFMGGTLRPPEFAWSVTDPDRVRAIVDAVKQR